MENTIIFCLRREFLTFFLLVLLFVLVNHKSTGIIFCKRPANETEIRRRLFPSALDLNSNSSSSSSSSEYVYPYGSRIRLMVSPLGLWELSEQTDIASLLFYVKIVWKDPSKSWNNISSRECLMVPFDAPVWKPIIKFVDDRSMLISARVIYQPEIMHLLADGTFFYTNIFQVRQIVRFDTAQFPFDQVRLEVMCNVDNVYSSDLDYVPSRPGENRTLKLTPDWELVKNFCQKDNTNATECEIVVARNAQFYIVNFCVPTLATTTLAVFGIHSAVQVHSRSSKYQMGLMALISLSTVSFSFVGSLPRSGHVSRLHVFYFGMVGAIFSSCLISWAILSVEKSRRWSRWHQKHHHRVHRTAEESSARKQNSSSSSNRRTRRRSSNNNNGYMLTSSMTNDNNTVAEGNNTIAVSTLCLNNNNHSSSHEREPERPPTAYNSPTDRSVVRYWITGAARCLRRWTPSRNFLRMVDAASVVIHVLALTSLTLWFMHTPQHHLDEE